MIMKQQERRRNEVLNKSISNEKNLQLEVIRKNRNLIEEVRGEKDNTILNEKEQNIKIRNFRNCNILKSNILYNVIKKKMETIIKKEDNKTLKNRIRQNKIK